jgi:hypothetical protein
VTRALCIRGMVLRGECGFCRYSADEAFEVGIGWSLYNNDEWRRNVLYISAGWQARGTVRRHVAL